MGFLAVIVAALGGFAIGAVYYGVLAGPWKQVSGVPLGEDGNPLNAKSPVPYATSFVCLLLVAGMMRHTLVTSGIDTIGAGLMTGVGVGAFFISPWLWLTNGYCMRPSRLSLIDSGYATIACGTVGAILPLF